MTSVQAGGIRIDLVGMLGRARCPVQIDIGYGDVVTPAPELVRFPTILDGSPIPIIKAYPRETVIAEKLEAIVSLGMANSRMKDFYDLNVLIHDLSDDQMLIATAIRRTFERRGTPITSYLPVGLSDEFAQERTKEIQWKAFLEKSKLEAPSLFSVVQTLRRFWQDIINRISE
ncbi:MAG: hypothetical protein A3J97_10095 [Spirochaetes bacterium RIFOXYC1_FULL_54_7]|nr:MAG: hypothetical protein A3J97_10095 [Spirochaetes bacterium RIFOXYC1_FULL_54_7]